MYHKLNFTYSKALVSLYSPKLHSLTKMTTKWFLRAKINISLSMKYNMHFLIYNVPTLKYRFRMFHLQTDQISSDCIIHINMYQRIDFNITWGCPTLHIPLPLSRYMHICKMYFIRLGGLQKSTTHRNKREREYSIACYKR